MAQASDEYLQDDLEDWICNECGELEKLYQGGLCRKCLSARFREIVIPVIDKWRAA